MRPLGTYVLIELAEETKSTNAGILLGAAAKKEKKGKIIAVSEGVEGYKMKTKIGDTVLYHGNAGVEYKHEGKDCLLIPEQQCIAIVD